MSTINESEKKRLQSLKEKKQAFKARGQLIKQALSNLVSKTIYCSKAIFFFYSYVHYYSILFIRIIVIFAG